MSWPSTRSTPPTTTCSGTTSMPCVRASSDGRYAVESVTTRTVTSRSFRRRERWCASTYRRGPGPAGEPGRAGGTTSERDDVDELGRSHDDGAHASLGRRLHLLAAEGELAQLVLGDVRAHLHPVTHLALDLDDAGDLLEHDLRGVAHRERGIRHPALVAEPLPHLLGDVRGHGRQHQHHGLDDLTRRRVELRHGVVELDELGDGRVEAQALEVLADPGDGLVQLRRQRLVEQGVHDAELAGGLVDDVAPQAL